MRKTTATLCLAVLVIAGTSMGATINKWQGGTAGNWTDTANWSTGVVPSPLQVDAVARFDDTGEGAVIDSAAADLYRLETGRRSASGVLSINTGGSITIDQFRTASDITGGTSSSTVDINGGALTIHGGNHGIGYAGTGVVNLNSGSFTSTDDIIVGRGGDTADGTLNMAGGTLTTVGNMTVGGRQIAEVDTGGVGAFNLSGGTAIIGSGSFLRVGNGGTGTMTVSGGSLTTEDFRIEGSALFSAAATLTGGVVHAGEVLIGENATLNLFLAATLDTYTLMDFTADGKLVWEGDHTADVAGFAAAGTFAGSGGVVDIATLIDGVDYDQSISTTEGFLLSKFDSGTGNTEVWTVVPEPATMGLFVTMGVGLFCFRRGSRRCR